jgi:hypothetical protein
MKIRFLLISIILILSLLLNSCSAPAFILKHTGDNVIIKMKNQSIYKGEFLFLKSDNFYLIPDEVHSNNPYAPKRYSVSAINLRQIESIVIEGYSDRRWGVPLLVFQATPALILAMVASSVNSDNFAPVLGIGSIPVLLTWLLFEGSTPVSPSFNNFGEPENLEELKKYSRFPQGLTDSQIKDLLKFHDQEEIGQIN